MTPSVIITPTGHWLTEAKGRDPRETDGRARRGGRERWRVKDRWGEREGGCRLCLSGERERERWGELKRKD